MQAKLCCLKNLCALHNFSKTNCFCQIDWSHLSQRTEHKIEVWIGVVHLQRQPLSKFNCWLINNIMFYPFNDIVWHDLAQRQTHMIFHHKLLIFNNIVILCYTGLLRIYIFSAELCVPEWTRLPHMQLELIFSTFSKLYRINY